MTATGATLLMYVTDSTENAVETVKDNSWGFGTVKKMECLMTVTTYLPHWMVLFHAPEQFGHSYITGYYTDTT